jgi:hypothetical protein
MNRSPVPPISDPFDRAERQLLEEERMLRALAEAEVREFRRLAVEFAGAFLAAELDAARRADPHFIARARPDDWRALLRTARRERLAGAGWTFRAQADAATTAEVGAKGPPETAGAPPPTNSIRPIATRTPQPVGARGPDTPLGTADFRLPPLPPAAPPRFADLLGAWPRESLALAILGVTGWSMRLAVADTMSAVPGRARINPTGLRRAFVALARRGFWIEQKVTLPGVHFPVADDDDDEADGDARQATTLVLVRLGDLGRDLLRACAVQPVASEWERLLAAGGRQAQSLHAGLACAFTYHARLRGWATAVLPGGEVVAQLGDEALSVWVAAGDAGLEPDWDDLPGRIALVALTPADRDLLVAAARASGAEHGLATDLQTLYAGQAECSPLWAIEW